MIGAGAAGLAAAHALIKAGVPTLVLEKESRLAEPWYPRPERLHLNSHRDLSTLPGVDYPAGTPAFPHKNAVVRYLNEFSRRMVCRSGLASPSRRSRSTAITGLLRPVQGEACGQAFAVASPMPEFRPTQSRSRSSGRGDD
ncbi:MULTISPECIES: NAD(P)-binding protein [unclassified Mesorhizobium]|uniref:NAD(P)-binding protein n=1 Tax=unclassified Mesorhizobium TaxID=325217 RepID=UPI001FEDF3B4|nr:MULTISPECIES: NAD(P)-binding protein [unclassified Mesorhizobium]